MLFSYFCRVKNGDDFDFHEVFADYFVSEFDDPLNAYTGGMANYDAHIPTIQMTNDGSSDPNVKRQSSGQNSLALPTGGIRTAFHAATSVPVSAPLQSPLPGGPPKKIKTEDTTADAIEKMHLHGSLVSGGDNNTQQPEPSAVLSNPQQVQNANNGGFHGSLPVGGIRFGNINQYLGDNSRDPSSGFVAGAPFGQMASGTDNPSLMWNLFNQHAETDMSEQAVAERRERNREHAKRSRVRKKFILESLQEQVRLLQVENSDLRLLVQEHMPENAMEIFEECCTKNPLFANPDTDKSNSNIFGINQQEGQGGTELVRSDFSLMSCLTSGQKCFVLSDPKLPDNPIVYATPDFYSMTGYTPREVLGRNCRFMQGPGTDKKAIDVLRKSISLGADATICLLNYKADGTPFWNQLFVAALRDSDNCIVNYVRKCYSSWIKFDFS